MTDDNDSARALRIAGLPRYESPVLDIIAEPPFLHRDTVLHAFVLRSDQAVLQTAIDDLFVPLGLQCNVASSAVLLTALYVRRATVAAGRYARFGWSSEIDVAFWALAERANGQLVWIPFYMFVDSGVALLAGREIYGFPKQLALFERDMTTLDSDPAVAVRTSFFPPSIAPLGAVNEILVRIDAARLNDGFLMKDLRAPERIETEQFLDLFAAAMGRPPGLRNDLTPPYGTPNGVSVPMLFLKQFRDAEAPGRACYRAAICADTRSIGAIRVSAMTERYVVDIAPSNSHPIARDLALVSGMTTEAGFIIHQDFDVNCASILA